MVATTRSVLCIVFLLLMLVTLGDFAQAQSVTVSGYVEDIDSGERILGASIYIPELQIGTISNQYGFYSLTTTSGSYTVSASHIGYDSIELNIQLNSDTTLTINLVSRVVGLGDVEVIAEREDDLESVQMSRHEISIEEVETLPVILGEIDIQKTLQLLPSVQSGVEGSSGLYVRGGRADQNLVLLDGLPLYNPSHLFGFFSVFNSSAMKQVELIKGGFPARYGGRLSSVVNYTMKEGNLKRYNGETSIGLLSIRGMMEGPIIKDEGSFLVAVRRTYIDQVLRPFQSGADERQGAMFYDLNLKANYILSSKDRIYLSAYGGQDDFTNVRGDPTGAIQDRNFDYDLEWWNRVASLRWNRQIGDRIFSNLLVGVIGYRFSSSTRSFLVQDDLTTEYNQSWKSKILDWTAKLDFEYIPSSSHYIRFGLESTLHHFNPGSSLTELNESGLAPRNLLSSPSGLIKSREMSIYVEDEIQLHSHLKMNAGLRVSQYSSTDTEFHSIEPRVGVNVRVASSTALKASYARSKQYVHLLSNGGSSFPTDLWIPSMKGITPQSGYQVAIGAIRTIKDSHYQVSVEGYYKKMEGLLEYQYGTDAYQASFLTWPEAIEQGAGSAYGAEVLIEKKRGVLTGWMSYTLARSTRKFERLNFGEPYPDGFDRRHDISIVTQYKLSEKTQFSAVWVYGSGYPVWVPTGQYQASFFTIFDAGPVNAARAPDYHRLDLSVNFTKSSSWGERIIQLAIYNAYNHRNPMFVYPQTDKFSCAPQSSPCFAQFSLLQLVPAVSWRWRFR